MPEEVIAQGTLQLVVDVNQAQIEAGVEDIARSIKDKLVKGTGEAETAFQRLGTAAKSVGKTFGALAAVGGVAMIGLATKSIKAGAGFNILQQKARASLTTILGTAAAANKLLEEVVALNSTSPFSQSSFIEATQQLIGFGVEANQVVGVLDAVQQATAAIGGSEAQILRLSGAFAKVASMGKLSGDVLLTFKEQGIDAAGAIADNLGISVAEFTDQVQAGMFTAGESIDLLTKALQNKFGGATENAATSFGTSMDRMSSRIRNIGADITKPFLNPFGGGLAIDIINNITKALDNIRKNVIPTLVPIVKSVGEEVKRLSEAFVRFTANIKPEQVEKFFDVLKLILPVLTGVGTALSQNLLVRIPVIGQFAAAFGPVVLAITVLAATVPEVRQVLIDLGTALQPLVEALLPLFQEVIKSLTTLLAAFVPVLGVVVTGIRFLVNALAPLITILSNLGPVNAALALFIARLAVLRVLGGGLNLASVGTALKGLASPLNVAIIGFTVLAARLADNTNKAKEFAAQFTKDIDTNNIEALEASIREATEAGEEAQKTANTLGGPIPLGPINIFWTDFFTKSRKAADDTKELKKTVDKLNEVKGFRKDLFAGVREAIPGKQTVEQLDAVVKSLGIRFEDLTATSLPFKIKEIVKEFGNLAKAGEEAASAADKVNAALLDDAISAQNSLTSATKEYQAALKGVEEAQKGVNDAIKDAAKANAAAAKGLVDANKSLTSATKEVTDAQTELDALLAEGGAEELAEARERLADATERVADATDRQTAAAAKLAELLAPATEQELANARDNQTTAEIGLARAIRKRDEALAALNATQEVAIDLSGLSLDGLKSTLANARASAAAQRAVTKTGKSQVELEEDAILAEIGVRDATDDVAASKTTLRDLELKGLVETPLITAARRDLAEADEDVTDAIEDETIERTALNLIESGASKHAEDVVIARGKVQTAEEGVKGALEGVAEAQINVAETAEEAAGRVTAAKAIEVTAHGTVATAIGGVQEAQRLLNEKTALALNDQEGILNAQIAILEQKMLTLPVDSALRGELQKQLDILLLQKEALRTMGTKSSLSSIAGITPGGVDRISAAMDLLTVAINGNTGEQQHIVRNLETWASATRGWVPSASAEGRLVTSPIISHIGEGYKPELILPLTKPDRVWQLLSRNLPKYPGALAAAQSAIFPAQSRPTSRLSISGSGGAATSSAQRKANKDLAQAIVAELVAAGIGKGGGGETNITIPVTTPVPDPRLLAREIERKITKSRRR